MFKYELEPNFRDTPSKSDKKLLGTSVFGHHTTQWLNGKTYGGLHSTSLEAEKGFIDSQGINSFSDLKRLGKEVGNGTVRVVELQKGEVFYPEGTGGLRYQHGVNDGTHGSTIRNEAHSKVLLPD